MERPPLPWPQALQELDRFDAIIDVRSPGEFAIDHVPGAINAPVLDDAERAEIGTLHKQVSAFDARRRGAALVAANIARHLEGQFSDRPRNWRPLVYCWRGGQRSGALATVMARIGWPAARLEGGYQAFRRGVLADLDTLPERVTLRVLCGTTGSGKSRLLTALRDTGAQVLDLEQLANHRGSVLGGMPKSPQPSQKMFETRIWHALRGFDPSLPVFVESESRKVGNLRVPDALIARMRASDCIVLDLPRAQRVRLLREEYLHYEETPADLLAQLECLTALHGRSTIDAWKALTLGGQWDQLVDRLLVEHYDPAYHRSIERNFTQLASARRVFAEHAGPDAFRMLALELTSE